MSVRRASFRLALSRLQAALQAAETDLTRDAAIQRFEFCFELAWKVIQEQARHEGLDCQSPKGCLKLAYKNQWLSAKLAGSPCWKTGIVRHTPTMRRLHEPSTADSPCTFHCCRRSIATSRVQPRKSTIASQPPDDTSPAQTARRSQNPRAEDFLSATFSGKRSDRSFRDDLESSRCLRSTR